MQYDLLIVTVNNLNFLITSLKRRYKYAYFNLVGISVSETYPKCYRLAGINNIYKAGKLSSSIILFN